MFNFLYCSLVNFDVFDRINLIPLLYMLVRGFKADSEPVSQRQLYCIYRRWQCKTSYLLHIYAEDTRFCIANNDRLHFPLYHLYHSGKENQAFQ